MSKLKRKEKENEKVGRVAVTKEVEKQQLVCSLENKDDCLMCGS